MEIIKNLCSPDKYNIKCPYEMIPEGITIHNTANDASARNEITYMISNNNDVSYHFAVDDIEAVQGIPLDRNAWHAGDGENGYGNRKTIGIEICYSLSGGDRFIQAEKNTAELIARLMLQYGWGLDRIGNQYINTHQYRSGKYCPHRTLDMGIDRFYNMIKEKYSELLGQPIPEPTIGKIAEIQQTLNERYNTGLKVDNVYGQYTHRALVIALQTEFNLQYNAGLDVDGIFGPLTKSACLNVEIGDKGNITWLIQAMLICKGYDLALDGKFGTETDSIVKRFQTNNGLIVDGIVGKNTFAKLFA